MLDRPDDRNVEVPASTSGIEGSLPCLAIKLHKQPATRYRSNLELCAFVRIGKMSPDNP